MSVREMSVREMSVGEMSVREMFSKGIVGKGNAGKAIVVKGKYRELFGFQGFLSFLERPFLRDSKAV